MAVCFSNNQCNFNNFLANDLSNLNDELKSPVPEELEDINNCGFEFSATPASNLDGDEKTDTDLDFLNTKTKIDEFFQQFKKVNGQFADVDELSNFPKLRREVSVLKAELTQERWMVNGADLATQKAYLAGIDFFYNTLDMTQKKSPNCISHVTFEIVRDLFAGRTWTKTDRIIKQGGMSDCCTMTLNEKEYLEKTITIHKTTNQGHGKEKRAIDKKARTATYQKEVNAYNQIPPHPHIISIAGKCNAEFKLLFPYCANGDLVSAMDNNVQFDKRGVAFQILLAIQHLHSRGFIHSDIKPQNILLDEHNNAYLADLGFLQKASGRCSRSGTPHFQDPSISKDGAEPTFASDIFSLGLVLYYIFSKDRYKEFGTVIDIIDHFKINDPNLQSIPLRQPLNIADPELDKDMQALLASMLSLDPKARPTIDQILNDRFFRDLNFDHKQKASPPRLYGTPQSSPSNPSSSPSSDSPFVDLREANTPSPQSFTFRKFVNESSSRAFLR